MKLITQGAEAKIFHDSDNDIIVKDRIKKDYRISEIDNHLRGFRTRREAKVIEKLTSINFPAPKLISSDDKEKLEIEFIKGPKLRDVLEKKDFKKLCKELGKKIRILHDNNIIHGDLTTSNLILNSKDNSIFFIDFGLSFFSPKIEDQAVDLHLLKQALESKHYTIWQECFEQILKCYDSKEVESRLKLVEKRGRYKGKH